MKKQILEKIEEVTITHSSPVINGNIVTRLINGDGIDRLIDFIQSLPDEQSAEPVLLPFQFPVPNGMEVVTRDGRKVEQLTEFKGVTYPYAGVIVGEEIIRSWPIDGRYSDEKEVKHDLDLFLRPIERKVWVVEHNDGLMWATQRKTELDEWIKEVGPKYIYEATLKQV